MPIIAQIRVGNLYIRRKWLNPELNLYFEAQHRDVMGLRTKLRLEQQWIPFFGYLFYIVDHNQKAFALLACSMFGAGVASAYIYGLSTMVIGTMIAASFGATLVEAVICSKRSVKLLGWEKADFECALDTFTWSGYHELSTFMLPYILVSVAILLR